MDAQDSISQVQLFYVGNACTVIWKNIFQIVKCAGHGKCCCDAEGGCHKTFCDKFFDKHVITPEQAADGCPGVPSQKVQDENSISLAETVRKILNDKDYAHGAISKTLRKKEMQPN